MADVKVRLLRNKRWPHPNGQRRPAGTVLSIPASMAAVWERGGLAARVDSGKPAPEPEQTTAPEQTPEVADVRGTDAPAPEAQDDAPPVRSRPTGSRKRKK